MNYKKGIITFLGLFIFAYSYSYGQENVKAKKVNFYLSMVAGGGNIVNEYEPGYNLLGENVELQISYNLSRNDGIATGVGYTELSGNGFNAKGNFYHERNAISIPLLYTRTDNYGRVTVRIGVGLQGNKITGDKYEYLAETKKDQFNGWSLSTKSNVALLYKITNNVEVGVSYDMSTDLSKYKSTDQAFFKGNQRMRFSKYLGLAINFGF